MEAPVEVQNIIKFAIYSTAFSLQVEVLMIYW